MSNTQAFMKGCLLVAMAAFAVVATQGLPVSAQYYDGYDYGNDYYDDSGFDSDYDDEWWEDSPYYSEEEWYDPSDWFDGNDSHGTTTTTRHTIRRTITTMTTSGSSVRP